MKVDMKGEEQCKMKAKQSCSKENLKKCFKSYTVKIEKFLLYVCLLPLSSLTSRTTRLMLWPNLLKFFVAPVAAKKKSQGTRLTLWCYSFFRTFLVDVVKRQQQTCKNSHFGHQSKISIFGAKMWLIFDPFENTTNLHWNKTRYFAQKFSLTILKKKYNFWTKSWVLPQCAKCMDLCWSSLVVLVLNPLIVYRMLPR